MSTDFQGVESNARTYARRFRCPLVSGEGIHVCDAEGRRYLDCLSGAGTMMLGHNHPVVTEAIERHLAARHLWHGLDIPTPTKIQFIERLFSLLPGGFAADARIQFCSPSGADAVEAAIKLVKTATGRRAFVAFRGSYHGMTHGALALTSDCGPKAPIANLMGEVHFFPYPYDYRCPFGLGGEPGAEMGLRYIEGALRDPHNGIGPVAGVIVEVLQGEGGAVPAPASWLRGLRRITHDLGIPLIIDEIQTGAGRTGRFLALEHAGVVPDVLLMS
jgi:diaminobutyrate-2-oxoglutarate transaminase